MTRDEYFDALRKSEEHLQHHGIAGQKWGDRNGPPYPMKRSQASAAEKKSKKFPSTSKKEKLTDTQREELSNYKAKMSKKLDKQEEKQNKKISAYTYTAEKHSEKLANSKFRTDISDNHAKLATEYSVKANALKIQQAVERSAVNNMTYSDMKKEISGVRKGRAKDIAKTIVIAAAAVPVTYLATGGAATATFIKPPKSNNTLRTEYRMSNYKKSLKNN